MMPGISGFDVIRTLKDDERTRGIPVLFLTALTEPEIKVHAFEVGAVDYITKPFDAGEVLARVNTHLTLRSRELELQDAYRKLAQLEPVREKPREGRDEAFRPMSEHGDDAVLIPPAGGHVKKRGRPCRFRFHVCSSLYCLPYHTD